MRSPPLKTSRALWSGVLCLLGLWLTAQGQSANDGFTPEPDGFIFAVATQPDGKLVIGGSFANVGGVSRACVARLNCDGTLDASFDPGADGPVTSLAVQPDGKILVGGVFGNLGGGGTGTTPCSCIGRLLSNGAVDTAFAPGASGSVDCLVPLTNGQIMVAGQFATLAGASCNYVGRLNTNGTLDATFMDPGADGAVTSLAVQPDGKLVLGGQFAVLDGVSSYALGRLNPNGALDPGFQSPVTDGYVRTLALQADGKIVVGGTFSMLNGQAHQFLGRLNPDGNPDLAFIDPQADLYVNTLAVQADGRILVGGEFDLLGGQSHPYIGRLNVDGRVDAQFLGTAGAAVSRIGFDSAGLILVGGRFSSLDNQTRHNLGRLNVDGSLDTTLNAGLDGTGTGVGVYSLAFQPDCKLLLGGLFSTLEGSSRTNLARLAPDGSLDSFNPAPNGLVRALAVQTDGRLVIGGNFSSVAGTTRSNFARLNYDGTLDRSFTNSVAGSGHTVYALALQPDGRLLVAGDFLTLNGQSHNYLGRFNADGSLDSAFIPTVDGVVYTVALQPDGGILLGGAFHTLNSAAHNALGRLTASGALDTTFNPTLSLNSGTLTVQALAVQGDSNIVVGGTFTLVNGQARTNLARLTTSGTIDAAFTPNVNAAIDTLALQTDGRILLGGNFNVVRNQLRNRIARLNADGTVDTKFDAGAGVLNTVYSIAPEVDGKIVIGGLFTVLAGQARMGIGRVTANSAALQSLMLEPSGNSLAWYRDGAGPELQGVTLEKSFDGTNFTQVAGGARISGGWRFSNVSPSFGHHAFLRARGRYSDGAGSSGLLESVLELYYPPLWLAAPVLLPNHAFQFSFSSVSGAVFIALASSDPTLPANAWTILGPIPEISAGEYIFADPAAASYPTRFYQVRLQ